jgi:hypothetical protein
MFRKITIVIAIIYAFMIPNVKAQGTSNVSSVVASGSNCVVSSPDILLPRTPPQLAGPFQRLNDLGVTIGVPGETAARSCTATLSMELGQSTTPFTQPIEIGYEIVFANGRIIQCSINSLSADFVGAEGPSTIQVEPTPNPRGTNTHTVLNKIGLGFGATESVKITPCARASTKVLALRNVIVRGINLERQAACLYVECPLGPE